jgi:hypothetical protein
MKAIQQISKLKTNQVESGWSILRKMQRKYKLNGKFFIVPTFWYERNSKMNSSLIINLYIHHGVSMLYVWPGSETQDSMHALQCVCTCDACDNWQHRLCNTGKLHY